jgi:hypothetical protein
MFLLQLQHCSIQMPNSAQHFSFSDEKDLKLMGQHYLFRPISLTNLSSKVKFEYFTAYCAALILAVLSSIIIGAQALSVSLNAEKYQLVHYNTLTVGISCLPYA